ncbi:hypothetical protein OIU85_010232 [Salix viminalis]|uniref:Uncharacterized protein n=2 Tax=Salix TaxID=40685 RepID=A0A9Q0SHB7_SALVM|nr:hypothetical protein OIU85_010232 [Salix viminalis]
MHFERDFHHCYSFIYRSAGPWANAIVIGAKGAQRHQPSLQNQRYLVTERRNLHDKMEKYRYCRFLVQDKDISVIKFALGRVDEGNIGKKTAILQPPWITILSALHR